MKSIVIYYSESGNTEKIAKAISGAIKSDLKKVDEIKPEEVSDYDLIFIGTPVHGSAPAKTVIKFLNNLLKLTNRKGAAFCTMHSFGDNKTFNIIKEKFEAKGILYIDGFSCLGQSRLIANFGPRIFNKDRPNEEDLKAAEQFAKTILEKFATI